MTGSSSTSASALSPTAQGWAKLAPGLSVGSVLADPKKVFWLGLIANWRVRNQRDEV